jgi:hypothetical protein
MVESPLSRFHCMYAPALKYWPPVGGKCAECAGVDMLFQ